MPAPVSSLIRAVDRARDRKVDGELVPLVVWQVLDAMPDPRRPRGRRHLLATVLAVAFGCRAGWRSVPDRDRGLDKDLAAPGRTTAC